MQNSNNSGTHRKRDYVKNKFAKLGFHSHPESHSHSQPEPSSLYYGMVAPVASSMSMPVPHFSQEYQGSYPPHPQAMPVAWSYSEQPDNFVSGDRGQMDSRTSGMKSSAQPNRLGGASDSNEGDKKKKKKVEDAKAGAGKDDKDDKKKKKKT